MKNLFGYSRVLAVGDIHGMYEKLIKLMANATLKTTWPKEGRLTKATEVHHIVPLDHGGTHDESNLMALCKPCHSRISIEMGDRFHKFRKK